MHTISIVTPSYNQAEYLPETIESVLGQKYPQLEYIVMDGGSNDGSVEIIRQHETELADWTSGKDGGQAAALNAGFCRARGDILGWLNSDDYLLPGTLRYVSEQINLARPEILFGNCFSFHQASAGASGSDVVRANAEKNLELVDFIIQPACFWNRKAFEVVGQLDESLCYAFDWDWFIRAKRSGVVFTATQRYLAAYRHHDSHKTGTGGVKREMELAEIYLRYAGEKYHAAFTACAEKRESLQLGRRWIRRLRVRRFERPLLRVLAGQAFKSLSNDEMSDIFEMSA